MLQQRSSPPHAERNRLPKAYPLILFTVAFIGGWLIRIATSPSDARAISSAAHPPSASGSDNVSSSRWKAEQAAVAAITDESLRHMAALRLAEKVFRHDPNDIPRFATWMRQLFPEESARHSSDWTLIRPERRYKDPEALDAIVAPLAFAAMVKDSENFLENGKTPYYLAGQAGSADPQQFLSLLNSDISDVCRAGIFANFPPDAHEYPELRDRLIQEAAGGQASLAAIPSLIFLLSAGDLSPSDASHTLTAAASSNPDGLSKVASNALMHLAKRALAHDPQAVLQCLPNTGSGRDWILKACAGSAVAPDLIPGLTAHERASYLSEHLANASNPTVSDVSVAINAIEALPGPDAQSATERLVESMLSHQANPTAALEAASAFPDPSTKSAFMHHLVRSWVKVDVVGASESLSKLPRGSLPDAAIATLVDEIHGDPLAAIVWAERMSSRPSGLAVARKVLANTPPQQRDAVAEAIAQRWPE
jgi:hypothetical protein